MFIENIYGNKSGDILSKKKSGDQQLKNMSSLQTQGILTSDMIIQGTGPIPTEYAP